MSATHGMKVKRLVEALLAKPEGLRWRDSQTPDTFELYIIGCRIVVTHGLSITPELFIYNKSGRLVERVAGRELRVGELAAAARREALHADAFIDGLLKELDNK